MNRRVFMVAGLASFGAQVMGQDGAQLKVAVIGHTGRGNYGHGMDTLWLHVPETKVVAVADADPKGLTAARKRLGDVPGYDDYRKMLSETRPDIVSIAPRHIDQHRDMVIACAEHGVRGIYMEKPFCRDLVEADEIIEICRTKGMKLALAHRNRYHPVLPSVRDRVKKGEIGRLLEIRTRGKEDHRGGGLDLWVLGSHVLNLACYFAGNPVSCSAVLLQDGRPVTKGDLQDGPEGTGPLGGNEIHARYEMESGVPVFFDSVKDAGITQPSFGMQLIGSKGVLDIRIDVEPLVHLMPKHPHDLKAEPTAWLPVTTAGVGKPETVADISLQVAGHKAAAQDLIAAMKENREPLCSAEDGRTTVEMILAVFESHRQGGARMAIPLKERTNPLTRLK